MHLLNLATTGTTGATGMAGAVRPDGPLTAPVTQQALADAVGTTRETVARALGELRDVGAIATGRNGIRLRDPEVLAVEAHRATGV
jgi:CRP-like cAMP-binding protein